MAPEPIQNFILLWCAEQALGTDMQTQFLQVPNDKHDRVDLDLFTIVTHSNGS